jgi:hypothetical protein
MLMRLVYFDSNLATVVSFALNRIALTTLGILIWLLVANLVFPVRATVGVRSQVAAFLTACREWHLKSPTSGNSQPTMKQVFDNPNTDYNPNNVPMNSPQSSTLPVTPTLPMTGAPLTTTSNSSNSSSIDPGFISLSTLSGGVAPTVVLIDPPSTLPVPRVDASTSTTELAVFPLDANSSTINNTPNNNNGVTHRIRFVTSDPLPPPPPPPLPPAPHSPTPPPPTASSSGGINNHDGVTIHSESKQELLSPQSSIPQSSSNTMITNPTISMPGVSSLATFNGISYGNGPYVATAGAAALAAMKTSLGSQQVLIDQAISEPDFWMTAFPAPIYRRIIKSEELLVLALADIQRSRRRLVSSKRESVPHRQAIR